MSTRERWIVYPLLFLTLGIAMRDKVVPPTTFRALEVRCNRLQSGQAAAQRIECGALTVPGPRNADAVRLGVAASGSGVLELANRDGRPMFAAGSDPAGFGGLVETFDNKGNPQIQLNSTASGGLLSTVGRGREIVVAMGQNGSDFGVFAYMPKLGQRIQLTLPWQVGPPPGQEKPQNPPPAKPAPAPKADSAKEPPPSGPKP